MDSAKIPLPEFLKILCANGLSGTKAIQVANKIYKLYNSPLQLRTLSDSKLTAAGISDKADRKDVLAVLKKAGYLGSKPASSAAKPGSSSSKPNAVETVTTPTKKRKRNHENPKDVNEFLPSRPVDEAATYGSMEFNEVLDEEILKNKSTHINRAPLLTAWSYLVAERLGFQREEALSIASVFTEMNAISKGVSLGIYEKGKEKDLEAPRGGSQPYVEIMGRRMYALGGLLSDTALTSHRLVLFSESTQTNPHIGAQWTTPHIMGALRLLSESFSPQQINKLGWSLYTDFRPDADGWGQRGEVKCTSILSLRKPGLQYQEPGPSPGLQEVIQYEESVHEASSASKKQKTASDDYDAAFDDDDFQHVDFAAIP